MANNNIIKTISVKVDSSEYKKTLQNIDRIQQKLDEIRKQREKYNPKSNLNKIDNEIKAAQQILKDSKALTKEEIKRQKDKIKYNEALKEEIKLQKRLANERKKEQKESQLNDIQKRKAALELEKIERINKERREKLENPEALGTINYIKQYKNQGIFGMGRNWIQDKIKNQGNSINKKYSDEIFNKEQKLKSNKLDIEKLNVEYKNETSSGKKAAITKKRKKLEADNALLSDDINNLKDKQSAEIGSTKLKGEAVNLAAREAEALIGGMKKAFSKLFNILLSPFKQLAQEVTATVKSMIDLQSGIATYNIGSSLVSNSSAREQMMKYGLDASTNYGFSKASEMLGIKGDEDLVYMNTSQRDLFIKYMNKYSSYYDKLASSGVLESIQMLQLDIQDLKNELAMEFLTWIAQNKDIIMNCIRGIFTAVSTISQFIMKILSFMRIPFNNSNSIATTSDIYNSNSNTNNTKNINMNINQVNNATGILSSAEALNNYNKEMWGILAKQIVTEMGD